MKNFEAIENLWRQQPAAAPADPQQIQVVQSETERVVKSRGRLLRWGAFVTALAIVVTPLLTVVNYVGGFRTPNAVGLAYFALTEVFQIGLLLVLLRQMRAHRQLRARSATNIREGTTASLTLIEHEMREYRIGIPVFVVVLLLATIPLLNGYHQGYYDASGALRRIAFLLGLGLVLLTAALRHYRRVLRPQREQLTALLGELRAE
jgi:hypothetical protein